MNRTHTASRAAAFYALVAALMTWPLLPQLTSAMPGDLGDPLLNAWILAWGADHVTALIGGDLNAFTHWWNANIFHPAPLALAYSEHMAPQVVAGLPVWWLTGNVLLVYNVLYLTSIVLSGLGAFLLVRDLTGRPRAALVAGLFFAFVPYRIAQTAHLQVLWAQSMPITLYALRRYLSARSARWWLAALAALVTQQLRAGTTWFTSRRLSRPGLRGSLRRARCGVTRACWRRWRSWARRTLRSRGRFSRRTCNCAPSGFRQGLSQRSRRFRRIRRRTSRPTKPTGPGDRH